MNNESFPSTDEGDYYTYWDDAEGRKFYEDQFSGKYYWKDPATGIFYEGEHQGWVTTPTKSYPKTTMVRPDKPPVFASPLAWRIAAEEEIDLRQIEGTGYGGRVTKVDIDAFLRRQGKPAISWQQPETQRGRSRNNTTTRKKREQKRMADDLPDFGWDDSCWPGACLIDGHAYVFSFEYQDDGTIRVYIEGMPSYGSRDRSPHSTHRNHDGKRYYVGWSALLRSLDDAKKIAEEWAKLTDQYVKIGKPF